MEIIVSFGIIGAISFLLILIRPIKILFIGIFKNKLNTEHISLIALVGILIHFYTITSVTGALPWMIIGASTGTSLFLKNK